MKVDNGGREYMAAMKMRSSDLQMWAFLPSDITPFPLRLPSPEAVPSQFPERGDVRIRSLTTLAQGLSYGHVRLPFPL